MEKRWHEILAGENVDEMNEKIHEITTQDSQEHVPKNPIKIEKIKISNILF